MVSYLGYCPHWFTVAYYLQYIPGVHISIYIHIHTPLEPALSLCRLLPTSCPYSPGPFQASNCKRLARILMLGGSLILDRVRDARKRASPELARRKTSVLAGGRRLCNTGVPFCHGTAGASTIKNHILIRF